MKKSTVTLTNRGVINGERAHWRPRSAKLAHWSKQGWLCS